MILFLSSIYSPPFSNNLDWIITVDNSSHYRLPRPSRMKRETIFVKTDMLTLTGRMGRDIANRKEKFILEWDYMLEEESKAKKLLELIENQQK